VKRTHFFVLTILFILLSNLSARQCDFRLFKSGKPATYETNTKNTKN
jgi:hypothetical protein